jgi:hypothetical protein
MCGTAVVFLAETMWLGSFLLSPFIDSNGRNFLFHDDHISVSKVIPKVSRLCPQTAKEGKSWHYSIGALINLLIQGRNINCRSITTLHNAAYILSRSNIT